MERMGFKIGDFVEWTSQAGGYAKSKRGLVVEVVPINAEPSRKPRGAGLGGRKHQSYIVEVLGETPRQKATLHWPVVSQLKLAAKLADKLAGSDVGA